MRTLVTAAAMSLWVVWVAPVMSADTLVMRAGSRVEGTVLAIAGRTITFRSADGVARRYPTSQVNSLEFFSADRAKPRAVNARRLEAPAGAAIELLSGAAVGAATEMLTTGGIVQGPCRDGSQVSPRQARNAPGRGLEICRSEDRRR